MLSCRIQHIIMRQLRITKQITVKESKSVEAYLQEISKLPLITAEEEVELAALISKGDQKALDSLIEGNLRFVVSVAKQYQNQGLKLADLINEGNVGLIRAAKRFDETRGFKFISYAVWWIRQSIMTAITEQIRIVRLPLNRVGDINQIRKVSPFLEQFHERPPSPEEIAEELNMNVSDVRSSMKNSNRHLSLDAPIKSGETTSLHDLVKSVDSPKPDRGLIRESLAIEIERALGSLPERERKIIVMFYGIDKSTPMNVAEIGKVYGITTERVRQIKEHAIKLLGQGARRELLEAFL